MCTFCEVNLFALVAIILTVTPIVFELYELCSDLVKMCAKRTYLYSVSLGMHDFRAPLKVLAIARSMDRFGDILLCTVFGNEIGRDAWATLASQVRSSVLLRASDIKCFSQWRWFVYSGSDIATLLTSRIF